MILSSQGDLFLLTGNPFRIISDASSTQVLTFRLSGNSVGYPGRLA